MPPPMMTTSARSDMGILLHDTNGKYRVMREQCRVARHRSIAGTQ
jgi:hypothetical protein